MKELLTEFFSRILTEAPANKTSPENEQLTKFGQTSLDGKTIYLYGPKSTPEGQRGVATATYYAFTGQTKQKQAFTQQLKKKVQAQQKGKAEPKTAPRRVKTPSQQPAATKQPTQVSIGGKPTPLTDPNAIDAAKTIDRQLNSPDNDAIFGYIDNPRTRKTRASALARLTAISADENLSDEKKAAVLQLEDGIRDLLALWSDYTTTGSKKSLQKAQKLAEQLHERYKFFSNSSGISFKTVMFGNKHRHIVGKGTPRRNGEPSNLAAELVDIFEKLGINLRTAKQGDKVVKDRLSAASKPKMGTPSYGVDRAGKRKKDPSIPADPVVKKLFESMPFIPEEFRSVFGPTENGQLMDNSGGKNAEAYFRHSVEQNTSLQETEKVLREEGMEGMADSIARHRQRMQKILENFSSMNPAEREKAVQDSYAQMAVELHKPPTGDSELCGSIMKNIAEINLYDQEIAAGKEVYLPAPGSFPGADKLVRVGGGTKGERLAGISVKYGKSGKVYGMPAQSSTITLFHPDDFYHNITTGRPGVSGFELGVRSDCLEKENWQKLMDGSGHGSGFGSKESEALRRACIAAAQFIEKKRGSGKVTNIGVRNAFAAAEESDAAAAIHGILFGDPESKEKTDRMIRTFGEERTKLLRNNPLAFASVLAVDSAIVTGQGFPQLLHCHQEIEKTDGGDVRFAQAVEEGTTDLDCWHYNFRATDERGGGIIMGYNCGDH